MNLLTDRTYQREIEPVPTFSCGGGCFDTVRESAVHGLQEVTVIGKKPGNLHQKSTVLRLKYGAFLHKKNHKLSLWRNRAVALIR